MKVVSGQALALNSLGINKFLSGDLHVANEMFQVKRVCAAPRQPRLVVSSDAARAPHPLLAPHAPTPFLLQRHLEIADVPGKFVAHTNLGLVEAAAGNFSAAAVNHRLALRCAIILRSIEGEALACGNLGIASRSVRTTRHFLQCPLASRVCLPAPCLTPSASSGGDTETARQCMQRYLKLAATLHDSSAQARAHEGLGKLAAAGECIWPVVCVRLQLV
jgi:hypothetical protein